MRDDDCDRVPGVPDHEGEGRPEPEPGDPVSPQESVEEAEAEEE